MTPRTLLILIVVVPSVAAAGWTAEPLEDAFVLGASQARTVWWTHGTAKIRPGDPVPQKRFPAVVLGAARGEFEPFQLVVEALEEPVTIAGLSVSVGEKTGPSGGRAAFTTRIERVENLRVDMASDASGSTGLWPDPLVPYDGSPETIGPGRRTVFFVTLGIPRDIAAGHLEGVVRLETKGSVETFPLRLRIWDFALPRTPSIPTAYGVTADIRWHRFQTGEQREAVHDAYMVNCREHRVSPYNPMRFAPITWTISGIPGKEVVTIQTDAFEKAARRYLDEFGFTGFRFNALPSRLHRHPRFSKHYNRLHPLVFKPIAEFLASHGWLKKAYVYWVDEPTEKQYDTVVAGMRLIRASHPGWRRLLTEQVEPPLVGHVDIWCSHIHFARPRDVAAAHDRGESFWWYVCTWPRSPWPNNFIDHPAPEHRIRFWMMEKFGIDGDLYWSATHYRGKKYAPRNPWTSAMSISPEGYPWGNGDGVLVYPPAREEPRQPLTRGPFNSLRWEMIREGLEDLEYFRELDRRIAMAEEKAEGLAEFEGEMLLAAAKRGRTEKAAALSMIDSLRSWDRSAHNLLHHRMRLARAIEALPRE